MSKAAYTHNTLESYKGGWKNEIYGWRQSSS